jgi:HAMP domain-containing protein
MKRSRGVLLLVVLIAAGVVATILVLRRPGSTADGTHAVATGEPRVAVSDSVADYANALRSSDSGRMCADMTPSARERIRSGAASFMADPTCANVLDAVSPQVVGRANAALGNFRIKNVVVHGDAGRALIIGQHASVPVKVRDVGGQWLVEGSER